MNDIDRLLQIGLRRLLDPVVATPAPPRRGLDRAASTARAITGSIELAAGPFPAAEPAVVAVPVAPAGLLP